LTFGFFEKSFLKTPAVPVRSRICAGFKIKRLYALFPDENQHVNLSISGPVTT